MPTVALYLLEGALGMPVFTGTPEKGIRLAYMVGLTGGYLLSYLPVAWIVGRAAGKVLAHPSCSRRRNVARRGRYSFDGGSSDGLSLQRRRVLDPAFACFG